MSNHTVYYFVGAVDDNCVCLVAFFGAVFSSIPLHFSTLLGINPIRSPIYILAFEFSIRDMSPLVPPP